MQLLQASYHCYSGYSPKKLWPDQPAEPKPSIARLLIAVTSIGKKTKHVYTLQNRT